MLNRKEFGDAFFRDAEAHRTYREEQTNGRVSLQKNMPTMPTS